MDTETAKTIKKCGLCGATKKLTKTECCDHWICNDESAYKIFSYSRNSCSRNHRRFTLCGSHQTEQHSGDWQDCSKCKDNFETEQYVYNGTNEYNFEVLKNPPKFKPTHCCQCKKVIRFGKDGYSIGREGYSCMNCSKHLLGL